MGEPPCLNPLLEACTQGTLDNLLTDLASFVLGSAYEEGPGYTFHSRLARVEFTKKPPYTLTYHIRPEASWSDGRPVSAQDFVFTHRAIRRHVSAETANMNLTHVQSVRAVGPKTVRVGLRARLAFWHRLFSPVLPRHALLGQDLTKVWLNRIDNPRTGRPIGSGPFLVESWQREKELVLRRHPRYWGSHPPHLDRIVLRLFPSGRGDLPADALMRGELHVAGLLHGGVIPSNLAEIRRAPGVRVVTYSSLSLEQFQIRVDPGGHPALESKLVRRALAYGIDRVRIVRDLYENVAPNARPSDGVVLPGYGSGWSEYRYDPDRARRLLVQAGCRLGNDGIYVCANERLSLTFITTAGRPARTRTLALAADHLRRAGVEVRTEFAPAASLFNDILPRGNFDLALFSIERVLPAGGLLPDLGCQGTSNVTGYCQRLVTRDLVQSERILDPAQRRRVLRRVDRQIAKDMPVLPLWWVQVPIAVRTSLKNFVPAGRGFWNAENWWLNR